MSQQRLVMSLILVNGKRELLGVEDIPISNKYVPNLEKVGQKFTSRVLHELLSLCEPESKPTEWPRSD